MARKEKRQPLKASPSRRTAKPHPEVLEHIPGDREVGVFRLEGRAARVFFSFSSPGGGLGQLAAACGKGPGGVVVSGQVGNWALEKEARQPDAPRSEHSGPGHPNAKLPPEWPMGLK